MLTSRRRLDSLGLLFGALLWGSVGSAEDPTQVLDRVNAVTPKAILDMSFADPGATYPFDVPITTDSAKGSFSACQVTATKGLVCIDRNLDPTSPGYGNPGRWVRKWDPVTADGEDPIKNTPLPSAPKPFFSCEDPALALDTSKNVASCTGITADENGGTVIAGKRKGGYNLIRVASRDEVVAKGYTCGPNTDPWRQLSSNPALCREVLLPRDRPLLVDITYAKLALPLGTCTGILGLETRTILMFFKDPDADDTSCPVTDPLVIADAKAWGLNTQAKEVLQGSTTIKLDGGASFVLVVSSTGRVLAKQTDATGKAPFAVKLSHASGTDTYDYISDTSAIVNSSTNTLRTSRPAADSDTCPAPPVPVPAQKYGIRTSTKSGSLYITDQNYCEVTALQPVEDENLEPSLRGLRVTQAPGRDFVLTTRLSAATYYPPLEPTIAPGISIDLSKCVGTEGCVLVGGNDGSVAARLSEVSLASSEKGMTLFQIKNIPDCRWMPAADQPSACEGAIVDPDNTGDPNKQFLNVAKLLPKELTDQFPDGFFGDPPHTPLYLSPEYRAQITPYPGHPERFDFDAFFFVPEPGVTWKDAFTLTLRINELTGSELGCMAPNIPGWPTGYQPVAALLKWDVATTISEHVKVIGGPVPPGGLLNTDIFINSGCSSLSLKSGRGSAFPYNLELNRTAYHSSAYDPPDDYFAHVVVDLFYDLRSALESEVCNSTGPTWPTKATICSQLRSAWDGARDKLSKCIESSNYPKQSQAINNCNSFNSQLTNFDDVVATIPPSNCDAGSATCYDRDNRAGEVEARAATIRHVFNDRLLPSVPPDTPTSSGGFKNPAYEGYGVPPRLPLPLWPPAP